MGSFGGFKVVEAGYRVEASDRVIYTDDVFSCLVGTFYDSVEEVRGLTHAEVPRFERGRENSVPFLFNKTVEEMLEEGAHIRDIDVHLIGGATETGEKNLSAAAEYLDYVGAEFSTEKASDGESDLDVAFYPDGDIEVNERPLSFQKL